jgi:hypothetical protein
METIIEVRLDDGIILRGVHAREDCKAPCPIHNPSDHHMKLWPTGWQLGVDQFKGYMERECPHGHKHPDPDSLLYTLGTGGRVVVDHTCTCGCCDSRKGFLCHLRYQATRK